MISDSIKSQNKPYIELQQSAIKEKAEDVFNDAEIIVKVKEPLSNEIKMIRWRQIYVTFSSSQKHWLKLKRLPLLGTFQWKM